MEDASLPSKQRVAGSIPAGRAMQFNNSGILLFLPYSTLVAHWVHISLKIRTLNRCRYGTLGPAELRYRMGVPTRKTKPSNR